MEYDQVQWQIMIQLIVLAQISWLWQATVDHSVVKGSSYRVEVVFTSHTDYRAIVAYGSFGYFCTTVIFTISQQMIEYVSGREMWILAILQSKGLTSKGRCDKRPQKSNKISWTVD